MLLLLHHLNSLFHPLFSILLLFCFPFVKVHYRVLVGASVKEALWLLVRHLLVHTLSVFCCFRMADREPISVIETNGVQCMSCSWMGMWKSLCALVNAGRWESGRTNSHDCFCRVTSLMGWCLTAYDGQQVKNAKPNMEQISVTRYSCNEHKHEPAVSPCLQEG